MPECLLMERDLMMAVETNLYLLKPFREPSHLMSLLASNLGSNGVPADPIPALIQSAVNPIVWDKGMPGKAIQILPVKIRLKETAGYQCKYRYPLKLEAHSGLKHLIDKCIHHGLKVLCRSLITLLFYL